MSNIFTGLLFIMLDFNLNIGETIHIGLIPDFIGYIILVKGLKELQSESENFRNLIPFANKAKVFAIIVYVYDIVPKSGLDIVTLALGLAMLFCNAYVSYNLIAGVKDLEIMYNCDMFSSKLMLYWKIGIICNLIGSVGIPAFGIFVIGAIIIGFIINIVFLVTFSNAKDRYFTYRQ